MIPVMPRSARLILDEVARKHSVPAISVFSRCRMAKYVWPRQEFMARANAYGFSAGRIALWFGFHHTSVTHGVESHKRREACGKTVWVPAKKVERPRVQPSSEWSERAKLFLAKGRAVRSELIAHRKAQAFALMLDGKRQCDAARALKVTPRTMWRWAKEMRRQTA